MVTPKNLSPGNRRLKAVNLNCPCPPYPETPFCAILNHGKQRNHSGKLSPKVQDGIDSETLSCSEQATRVICYGGSAIRVGGRVGVSSEVTYSHQSMSPTVALLARSPRLCTCIQISAWLVWLRIIGYLIGKLASS